MKLINSFYTNNTFLLYQITKSKVQKIIKKK